ncbi:MAG: DUF4401 domain-containing protein [Proteobacteria bacterium]|nr:DUF4401 domain-containing protein [Pseudomonadota bacterium]
MNAHGLWEALVAAKLVDGAAPPDAPPPTPWYVRALTGFAAWVASWFVLSTIGALSWRLLDSAPGPIVVGLVLCGAAAWGLRGGDRGTFVEQLALAVALAGQAAVAFGLMNAFSPHRILPLALLVAFELLLVAAIPHRVHRVLAVLAAAGAAYAILLLDVPRLPLVPVLTAAFAMTALVADRNAAVSAWAAPVAAGLALAVCAAAGAMPLVDAFSVGRVPYGARDRMGWLLLAVVFAATAAAIVHARGPADRLARLGIGAGVVALCGFAWAVPGLLAAATVAVVAFAMARPALLGVGLVTALWMTAYYYYALDASLLVKAASLALCGAVLVAIGLVLPRLVAPAEARS